MQREGPFSALLAFGADWSALRGQAKLACMTTRADDPIAEHNRKAWNRQADKGCRWSTPVTGAEVAAARAGRPRIYLTPDTPVPHAWLGLLEGKDVLCLASSLTGPNRVPVSPLLDIMSLTGRKKGL